MQLQPNSNKLILAPENFAGMSVEKRGHCFMCRVQMWNLFGTKFLKLFLEWFM